MRTFAIVAVTMLLTAGTTRATMTLTDSFDLGISPSRWSTWTVFEAAGSSWTIAAPDASGRLRIFKNADSDAATDKNESDAFAGARFTLLGDFDVSVRVDLLTFPTGTFTGANEALLRLVTNNGQTFFETYAAAGQQYSVGAFSASTASADVFGAASAIPTLSSATLGVSRSGATMTAWFDVGAGRQVLGDATANDYLGSAEIHLMGAQVCAAPQGRPHTAMDIAFDDFTVTAETIVPEPATLSLLVLGGLAMLKRWRQ